MFLLFVHALCRCCINILHEHIAWAWPWMWPKHKK
jgi:hypothetical protein